MYLQRFREMPNKPHKKIPFLNITMFGGVGVGKSSFLNTVATALNNDPSVVIKYYKTAPIRSGKSKTKTVSLFSFILSYVLAKFMCLLQQDQ